MTVSAPFLDFVRETFAPFGDIVIKRMFGAAGVYCDGVFFAVADDDTLYLKTDAETRPAFEAAGLRPAIIRDSKGGETPISYYGAPESIFEDAEALAHWTGLALTAARRKAARKSPRKRRGAS